MVIKSSLSSSTAIIVVDTSIKNDIAISILHMYISNYPLTRTIHHTNFITSTEAELFAIRCSINQASTKEDISKIIVITDSIYVAKKIFNLSSLLWQPLDQCLIAAQVVNLKGRYLVGNTSCVIHKRTRQRTTTVFYQLFI